MSRSRVVASRARSHLGCQFAQFACGDSLVSARACLPRFARLHVRFGVDLGVTSISPMVLRSSPRRWERACGCVAVPRTERAGRATPTFQPMPL